MKFEFLYDGYMLDIEAENKADEKLLDTLRDYETSTFANARFKDTKRRALIIGFHKHGIEPGSADVTP